MMELILVPIGHKFLVKWRLFDYFKLRFSNKFSSQISKILIADAWKFLTHILLKHTIWWILFSKQSCFMEMLTLLILFIYIRVWVLLVSMASHLSSWMGLWYYSNVFILNAVMNWGILKKKTTFIYSLITSFSINCM